MNPEPKVDEAKLNAFVGQVVGDVASAASAVMVLLGDKLGLYKALAERGPSTPEELAEAAKVAPRYVVEWLGNQTAGGYLTYDAKKSRYALTPESAQVLANEASPVFMAGAFQVVLAMFRGLPKTQEIFRSGKGLAWGEQDGCLFEGTERLFRPGYVNNLVQSWLPALEGVESKLERGARVADVGCGHGASTIVMAKRYPKSKFFGFDSHAGSIEVARDRARAAGVQDRVHFEVADATRYSGDGYDLVAVFDCFHDLGDPLGAATRARHALNADGTFLMVEPAARDHVEDNINPVSRLFYAASTCLCVPCSLATDGPALGAQAGQGRLEAIVRKAGFSRFRLATQTPFNLVLEARP
jgi:SAM-dependent methyltransferase